MEKIEDVGLEVYKDLQKNPSSEDFTYLEKKLKEKYVSLPHDIKEVYPKFTYQEWYKIFNDIEFDITKIKKKSPILRRAITHRVLPESILNELPLKEYESLGGDKEKAIRQLNELYQWLPKCYVKVNKGDYSFLIDIVEKYIYLKKFK